tara:strand:- start:259 stop:645 length:387 start_codon:yes stop_codon:yes gene_type:complete
MSHLSDLALLAKANIPIGVWVVLAIAGIWAVVGVHFALAEGIIPVAHPGYCRADTGCPTTLAALTSLQADFSEASLARLREAMRENQALLCKEPINADRYQEYIDQDQIAYARLNNGSHYKLRMDCPN